MLQMGKRETAFVLSLESLQCRKARRKGRQGGKESKEEGQAKGRQHVKWMVVE